MDVLVSSRERQGFQYDANGVDKQFCLTRRKLSSEIRKRHPCLIHTLPKSYPRSTQGVAKVYPRSTQGVPKVYPRCSQGVAKSKWLAYPWVVLEYYLGRVWVERRNKAVANNCFCSLGFVSISQRT